MELCFGVAFYRMCIAYLQSSITISFLDDFVDQLQTRFTDQRTSTLVNVKILYFQICVPLKIFNLVKKIEPHENFMDPNLLRHLLESCLNTIFGFLFLYSCLHYFFLYFLPNLPNFVTIVLSNTSWVSLSTRLFIYQ